jgi:heme A synthase
MRGTYRVLAGLIAIGVILQAMVIALGGFTVLNDVDGGEVFDKNSDPNVGQLLHGYIGMMIIPLVALLLLIVSFFAKVDGGIKWALYVVGLVALQIALAFASFGAPVVGLLHGLNAFALAAVASMAARRARSVAPAEADATTQPTV